MSFPRKRESRKITSNIDMGVIYLKNKPKKTYFLYVLLDSRLRGKALLRRPVKPTVSPRGLTTGSIKTIKNTNNFSIFNWISWSSHGMTEVKLIHATIPPRNDDLVSTQAMPSLQFTWIKAKINLFPMVKTSRIKIFDGACLPYRSNCIIR